jgi:hypothetical protein
MAAFAAGNRSQRCKVAGDECFRVASGARHHFQWLVTHVEVNLALTANSTTPFIGFLIAFNGFK